VEINIRNATKDDAEYIAAHMRDADKHEIWASTRSKPIDTVNRCLKTAECICVLVDNVPTILFGCDDYKFGIPWMLSTDGINKIGFRFVKHSQHYIKKWLARHKVLMNFVHAENKVSIKWLKWLGFDIKNQIFINNEPFHIFQFRR